MSDGTPTGEVIEFPTDTHERPEGARTVPTPTPDEAADRSGTDTAPIRDPHGDVRPDEPGDSDRALVDRPSGPEPGKLATALRSGVEQRRPVVPAWARSAGELHATARWLAGYLAHASAYHAVRAPTYAGRLAVRSPRGAARVVSWVSRWVADAEAAPLRWDAVRRNDPDTYIKLLRKRDDRVGLSRLPCKP
ncbi:MAG: hypothetical protein ACRDQA_08605 [Nocardioidaceae bacterium]